MVYHFYFSNSPLHSAPLQKIVVSSSSDDLLSPSPASINSTPILRNSLSDFELNTSSRDKSLDYYNFCAPTLPAHSTSSTLSLRNKQTLTSGRKPRQSNDALTEASPMRSEMDSGSDPNILSPPYASVKHLDLGAGTSYGRKLKCRSSSCDCLDMRDPVAKNLATLSDERPESHNSMYDKLIPLADIRNPAKSSIYDSLGPSKEDVKSGSSSPDLSDSPTERNFLHGRKINYLKKSHKYEYIDVDLESRGSEKSGSSSPIGMEHPADWTNTLPINLIHHDGAKLVKKSTRPSFSKETKTMPRRKHLPLQESDREQSSSETEYTSVKKIRPPRLSRENSGDPADQAKSTSIFVNTNHKSQTRSSVESMELISSTDSVPGSRRASVFSNGSVSSTELELKHNHTASDHVKREHSNSSSHRGTHEETEIKTKNVSPIDQIDTAVLQPNATEPPPIPKRTLSDASPKHSEKSREKKGKVNNGSPPLPPRLQEPRFTVPLPQAQFNFINPPPLPRPRVLCPSDLSYAAVTFASGETPVYSHVEPVSRSNRPSIKISQIPGDVSYVAVDFEMTAGLKRTSEQVADHHREFFQTKQQS